MPNWHSDLKCCCQCAATSEADTTGSPLAIACAITAAEPGRAVSAGVFEGRDTANMPRAELADLIKDLTAQMMTAARDLQFELAARFRDEISDLKKELRGMDAAGLK